MWRDSEGWCKAVQWYEVRKSKKPYANGLLSYLLAILGPRAARSAFAIEVQHLAAILCERINGRLGWRCVGKISMRQGPIDRRAKGPRRTPPPPLEAVAAAGKLSEGILDDGLREALTRLGARVLTKPMVK